METMKRLLFEDPLPIYVVLAVAEVVLVFVWRRLRTRGWALALLAGPVLATAVGLTAHFVRTDTEQIKSALDAIGLAVEANDVDAAAAYLDPDCRAATSRGRTISRDAIVEAGRRALRHWPVERLLPGEPELHIDGDNATTRIKTRIIFRSGEGGIDADWRLRWARREAGWRIVLVEALSPPMLADWGF